MRTSLPRTDSTLACNPTAIDASGRLRYQELRSRLLSAVRERREIPMGYAFRIDASVISLPEAAEWIDMERKCCPFLTLELEVSGTQLGWWLRLTGPSGVKAFLAAELSLQAE